MRESLFPAVASALLAVFLLALTAGAAAQLTPAEQKEANTEQRREVVQPLNNEPVWKEVRSGAPQTTTVRGRETNVLIQPAGETGRTLRHSMVSVYAGWALVVMLLVIAAFYFWKGTLELHEPATGRKIRRFTNWQMAI